jgi:hypothetical protein
VSTIKAYNGGEVRISFGERGGRRVQTQHTLFL